MASSPPAGGDDIESLTDIRIFVAAYEERSFTAAAMREHATQSGVSQHIRKLEEAYGVSLFTRSKGQVAPTPAADAYYERCIQVLRCLAAGKSAVRAFAGIAGDVHVGLMPTMTRATLAPSIKRVVEEHPNVVVHVVEAYSRILTEKVITGDLDFAIVPAFVGGPGLKVQPFLQTWETLVAHPNRGAHLSRVRLRDGPPLRVVLPSGVNTRRGTLDTYIRSNAVPIDRMLEMDTMMGALDLVATSDWVTIVPALLMNGDIDGRQFSVSLIVDPVATLDLVLIEPLRQTLSPAAQAFLDIIKAEAHRLNEVWRELFSETVAPHQTPSIAFRAADLPQTALT
ncbi:LysR family transcriptional regulator [Lichenifustis flavocetrariae]|uniref:LysR family transcriptional regulator n=1 Tax=Lichenifustis flavocetrariae TaxID=2949735 RepID=A0AA42CM58_9HYPH|nr:LysR family transcriptional regulator [Lichenifustis flavocetrariae]MCW6511191.1 LysR family transcriptional regulator [Lichenifustis flavocetrariae]